MTLKAFLGESLILQLKKGNFSDCHGQALPDIYSEQGFLTIGIDHLTGNLY